jgi:hypothetical protein
MFEVLKRWGAMRYPWPLWLIPVLLISPAALLIPLNVFDQYPWVKAYADWLAQWIPMIDRAAHLHPHPQQFKAFFAYAWSWLPLCFVLAWFDGKDRQREKLCSQIKTPTLFFAMLLLCVAVAVLWLAPGNLLLEKRTISPHDQRAFLYRSAISWLWFGPFQIYATAFLSIGIGRYVSLLIGGYYSNSKPPN